VRRLPLLLVLCAFALVWTSECSAQVFPKKKKVDKSTDATNTAEPDKQLYDKAMDDIKHGRHEVGRLSLQTLINTYPDSEYLAKAKLAIADSYFKQGGSSNITQAINGYKDFIVFFPFLPEAAYAQMQVAMANYNEMAKADRDNSHALDAENEFQTFLQKYPKDPLAPQAEQKLRDVQEILAEGQYRIAYYYYVKGDRRAAAGRLIPLVRRYPLYSKSDTALWMLGDIYERSERKDIAGSYYAQIVKNYPLSAKADDARNKLKAFGMPVPQPDPKAAAWMQAQQNAPRPKEPVWHKPMDIVHSGPDVRMAAVSGIPNMQPQSEDQGSVDVLSGKNATMGNSASGRTGIVATVPVGSGSGGDGSASTGASSEDVNSSSATESSPGAAAAGDSNATPNASAGDAQHNATGSNPPANAAVAPAEGGANATGAQNSSSGTEGQASSNGASANGSSSDGSNSADNTQPTNGNSSQDSKQKESSSKKKGLKKLIPW
jgi:outer membrane protein assembly factor BamD